MGQRDICTNVVTSVMWGTYQIIETRGICACANWEVGGSRPHSHGLTGAMPPCCCGLRQDDGELLIIRSWLLT